MGGEKLLLVKWQKGGSRKEILFPPILCLTSHILRFYTFVLGKSPNYSGILKDFELFFLAPKNEVACSHLPSDAFYCPERDSLGWWGLVADIDLGISSFSLHSDYKPNIISSSLQKEEKENV